MKTVLRLIAWVITLVIMASCKNTNFGNSAMDKIISDNEISDSAGVYTYAASGEKVTGTVENKIQFLDRMIVRQLKISDGVALQLKDFDLNMNPIGKCTLKDGKLNGEYEGYDDKGRLFICTLVDGTVDGLYRLYNSDGIQIKEVQYSQGKKIKSYDFDANGEKIIPVEDCLELVGYKTGYYESVNYNRNQVLYQPMVIFKFKNITDKPLDKEVKLTCVFIKDNEEWSEDFTYFQDKYSDTPLSPNMSRQCHMQSSVGWTNSWSIGSSDVTCEIQMNGKPYKTLKIANQLLVSNMM